MSATEVSTAECNNECQFLHSQENPELGQKYCYEVRALIVYNSTSAYKWLINGGEGFKKFY